MLITCGCVDDLVYAYANASGCVGAHFLFEWRAVAMLARTSFLSGALWLCWRALPIWVARSVAMLARTSFLGGALCGYVGAHFLFGWRALWLCWRALPIWVACSVAMLPYSLFSNHYIFLKSHLK